MEDEAAKSTGAGVLKLKEGIEASLFDDGGEKPTYLIRLQHRHWRVSETIYRIYACLENGAGSLTEIRDALWKTYSLPIGEQKLEQMMEVTFVRYGLLEGTMPTSAPPKNKMMWGQFTLLRARWIEKLKGLSFLFHKICLLGLSILATGWLMFIMATNSNHEIIESLFHLSIGDMVLCYAFVFLAGLVHEFGHSVSAMSYGVPPGRIGVGVYYIMPVLFADVTRVWRIRRHQRVVVDLAGMYLQGVFLMVIYGINLLVLKNHLLGIAILLSGFTIAGNFNPFIKFDGYWVLVDFLGITEVTSVIRQLWMNVLNRLLRRPQQQPIPLNLTKKTILYIYSICTAGFFVYFFRFLLSSVEMAVKTLASDLSTLIHPSGEGIDFTLRGTYDYLSSRVTMLIVLVFFCNMLWRYIGSKLLVRLKKPRTSPQEEVRYAAH